MGQQRGLLLQRKHLHHQDDDWTGHASMAMGAGKRGASFGEWSPMDGCGAVGSLSGSVAGYVCRWSRAERHAYNWSGDYFLMNESSPLCRFHEPWAVLVSPTHTPPGSALLGPPTWFPLCFCPRRLKVGRLTCHLSPTAPTVPHQLRAVRLAWPSPLASPTSFHACECANSMFPLLLISLLSTPHPTRAAGAPHALRWRATPNGYPHHAHESPARIQHATPPAQARRHASASRHEACAPSDVSPITGPQGIKPA